MPTDALESILYRELSIVSAKEIIDVASLLLRELVNFATNALIRCATSLPGKIDEDVALLALYRHTIEMTDGIEVLISQCCPVPAIPALRSSFEALLAIEYIIENEKDYVQRSLSWLVGYVHQRLAMYERLDPSTNRGKHFAEVFKNDLVASKLELPPISDVQNAIDNLQSMLTKPHLQPIEAEFSRHKRPNWYQLFGGPQKLYDLALYLNKGAQYDVLYRDWSRLSHSQDLLPFLSRNFQGEPAIGILRNPKDIQQVTSFAANFSLSATRLIIGKIRPSENLSNWYKGEVMANYKFITGIE